MYNKIQSLLKENIDKNCIMGENNIQLYLILYAATVSCLVIHIIQLFVFIIFGVQLYVILNTASIASYIAALKLCKKRLYIAADAVISIEVCVYTFVVSATSGVQSYILCYYLFVIILQAILPYGELKKRFLVMVVVFVIFLINISICMSSNRIIHINEDLTAVFLIFNLSVVFTGVVIQLCIGDIIKYITYQINQNHIKELINLANRDHLTGLFNRRYANEVLPEFAKDQRIKWCVAILDIDNFKKINDTYGHDCGDDVLKYLAEFLRTNLRSTDVLFRWGGEEFLILLCDIDLNTSEKVLDVCRHKFNSAPIASKEHVIPVTFTIGVSVLGKNVNKSIKESDEKLYYGKQYGKNRVVKDLHKVKMRG